MDSRMSMYSSTLFWWIGGLEDPLIVQSSPDLACCMDKRQKLGLQVRPTEQDPPTHRNSCDCVAVIFSESPSYWVANCWFCNISRCFFWRRPPIVSFARQSRIEAQTAGVVASEKRFRATPSDLHELISSMYDTPSIETGWAGLQVLVLYMAMPHHCLALSLLCHGLPLGEQQSKSGRLIPPPTQRYLFLFLFFFHFFFERTKPSFFFCPPSSNRSLRLWWSLQAIIIVTTNGEASLIMARIA